MQKLTIPQLSRKQFRELVKKITDISDEMEVDSKNKVISCDVSDEDMTILMKEAADKHGGLFPLDIVDRITPDTMEAIRDSFVKKYPQQYNNSNLVNDYFEGSFNEILDHIYAGLTPHEIIQLHPGDQPEAYNYVFQTDAGYVCFHKLTNMLTPQTAIEKYAEPEDDDFETV